MQYLRRIKMVNLSIQNKIKQIEDNVKKLKKDYQSFEKKIIVKKTKKK